MHVLDPVRYLSSEDVILIGRHTLYQCFFTEPSVLVGKVYQSCFSLQFVPSAHTVKTYLCDLCPTVSRISHLLKPQLLSRRPGSIGSALLSWRRHDWSCIRIVCGGLRLGSRLRSHLRSRRRGRRWLNLRGGDGRGRRIRDWRRGSRRRGSLSLTTRLSRCRSRSLLRRRGTVGRLLRNVHGRLNGGRMMLLRRRRHVWLRSAVGKLHALVPAGHVLLVRRMRITIKARWLVVLLLLGGNRCHNLAWRWPTKKQASRVTPGTRTSSPVNASTSIARGYKPEKRGGDTQLADVPQGDANMIIPRSIAETAPCSKSHARGHARRCTENMRTKGVLTGFHWADECWNWSRHNLA